jgi:hypothetical protein
MFLDFVKCAPLPGTPEFDAQVQVLLALAKECKHGLDALFSYYALDPTFSNEAIEVVKSFLQDL